LFVRRLRAWNEHHLIEMPPFGRRASAEQVTVMNRIIAPSKTESPHRCVTRLSKVTSSWVHGISLAVLQAMLLDFPRNVHRAFRKERKKDASFISALFGTGYGIEPLNPSIVLLLESSWADV
jgi:hypothetical protein